MVATLFLESFENHKNIPCVKYGAFQFKSGKKSNNPMILKNWYRVALLVEALRYKLEGRGFNSRQGNC
jgi:hypothetical protein